MIDYKEQDKSLVFNINNKQVSVSPYERTTCEIWTRVMGYHRPVSSFNTGKKGEVLTRKYFVEPKDVDDVKEN